MKSAKEILSDYDKFAEIPAVYERQTVIAAMEEYAAQFKKSPSQSAEQEAEAYADEHVPNANAFDAPFYTTGDVWEIAKSAYIAGHNSKVSVHSEAEQEADTVDPIKAAEMVYEGMEPLFKALHEKSTFVTAYAIALEYRQSIKPN